MLLALVAAGRSRDEAYRIVQRDARAAATEEPGLPDGARGRSRRRPDPGRSSTRPSISAGRCATPTDSPTPSTGWSAGTPSERRRDPGAPALLSTGKVRELYDAGPGLILMVASDRISAFDVVMAEPIPDKGRVLTAMTAFWCAELADLAPGSLVTADPAAIADMVPGAAALGDLAGRAMLVRRAEMLPLECIVRGYLAGQAFNEYQAQGTVHGTRLRAGLALADRLDEPMFTPSTKAEVGHDENIDFAGAVALVGAETAAAARDLCLALYHRAAERAAAAGFVLADTKFELGMVDGQLTLCDEVVTPDSSRLWPADEVVSGETPPAFDKQPLRDWLAAQPWDRRPHRRRSLTRWWRPHPPATWPPTSESPGGSCVTGTVRGDEVRRAGGGPAPPRDRRPGGHHHRAGAARPRLRRGAPRPGRPLLPFRGGGGRRAGGPPAGRCARRPVAGQPGDRGEPSRARGPRGAG